MATIGLIGGTGDLGTALAIHLSKKHLVLLGSRSLVKASSAVEDILKEKPGRDYLRTNLRPVENSTAAQKCDILILTVPHSTVLDTIRSLNAKFQDNQIIISAAAAVAKEGEEFRVDESGVTGSYAEGVKSLVPATVKVAAAFQTVPANVLYKEREISADVPVAADYLETYRQVALLISDIEGLRPLFVGSLRQAAEIESLTAFLLNIGTKNKLRSPTIKFPSF
jgi:8-hydroxy-5-deazaflavin:NADPH oxidoreductase